ncbi:ADP-ribosylation/crystallin J1 [Chitinophaga rhizophila]|uniref:ADP-ribosylation/crystallin J1 n=1 Tax=Chitinophaga rhizophila TaxID=2866212 RepID=A0ABS7GCD3_9BACT|nr:ADP-ribosylation/crystallin J1 [Chitinophaga rhizophila]MBW8684347.1 ADP-ribosylation/crystallin J1 [Chitinophaga rhizophila]
MKTTTLYRPTGLKELELIAATDFKHFPPRLSWQPIFYPVLNQQYAEQIALEWNTQDEGSGYCGIVTMFEVDSTFLERYEVQNVGDGSHNELWVPAEELELFNQHISGDIIVVKAFIGEQFVAPADERLAAMIVSRSI